MIALCARSSLAGTRRGFGAACHAGLRAATAELVCFCDCDGSLDPADLPRVTAPILNRDAELVLARHDINIAGIQLGRDHPRGRAVMLMQIDESVSDELLTDIQHAARLASLQVVTL